MKTKQIIINSSIIALISLGVVGCGSSSTTTGTEAITTMCDTNNLSAYHTLNSGDTISKAETLVGEDTTVPKYTIVMTSDGEKKVCKISGSAVIIHP